MGVMMRLFMNVQTQLDYRQGAIHSIPKALIDLMSQFMARQAGLYDLLLEM
jgi:hypothetical protein